MEPIDLDIIQYTPVLTGEVFEVESDDECEYCDGEGCLFCIDIPST